jgi:hypothetical protein
VQVEQDEKQVLFPSWHGLAPDLILAPANSARSAKNFVLDEVPGELCRRQGLGSAWSIGSATGHNPSISFKPHSIELNPYVVKSRRSQGEMVAWEKYRTTAHGGATIDVVMMKYRNRACTPTANYVYTYGIFVRPFWNGSVWYDSWQELTEFWDLHVYAIHGTWHQWLVVDSDPATWLFGDSDNLVFPKEAGTGYGNGYENQYYFRSWTVENLESAKQYNRFTRILASKCTDIDANDRGLLELQIIDSAWDQFGWQVGDNIRIHRNYIYQQNRFSASDDVDIDPRIFSLEDGMRISTGLGTYKSRYFIGFGEYGRSDLVPKEQLANGVILDDQFYDPVDSCIYVGLFSHGGAGTPMLAGTYRAAYSVLTGKSWSPLKHCPKYDGVHSRFDATDDSGITIAEDEKIVVHVMLQVGIFPRSATRLRIYLENVDSPGFFQSKELDLTDCGNVYDDARADYYDGTNTWKTNGILLYVDLTDMEGAEASADLGRGTADGAPGYWNTVGIASNKVAYGDVMVGGIRYPNRVCVTPASGDGAIQTDLICIGPQTSFDQLQSDPNPIKSLIGIDDRLLILTDQTGSILSLRGEAELWHWEPITSDDGVAAINSVLIVNRRVYWAGHYGIWTFTPNEGKALLNPAWIKSYKAILGVENAVAGYDLLHGRYCLFAGNKWYWFPMRTPELTPGDALPVEFNKTPIWILKPPATNLSFVSDDQFLCVSSDETLDIGPTGFDCEFETSPIYSPFANFDILIEGFRAEYQSDVAVTIALYLDDSDTAFSTRICPAGLGAITHFDYFDLSARCKSFRLKISATVTAKDQIVRIKTLRILRSIYPAMGDVL